MRIRDIYSVLSVKRGARSASLTPFDSDSCSLEDSLEGEFYDKEFKRSDKKSKNKDCLVRMRRIKKEKCEVDPLLFLVSSSPESNTIEKYTMDTQSQRVMQVSREISVK